MRSLIGFTITVAVLFAAFPVMADDVQWLEQPSLDDVLKKAKSENKYVLIDFYTLWCSPCKQMDKETYTDAKVVAFLNEAVPVKYDSEKDVGIEVTKKYRVNFWPTTVLLGPDGNEVGRYVGYLDAGGFIQVMGDYRKGIGTIAYYENKIEENRGDPVAWKKLGLLYGDKREAEKSAKALNRYLELTPDASKDELAEVQYTIGEVSYSSESYGQGIAVFEQFLKDFPDAEDYDSAITLLARCYNKSGDADKAVAVYMTYVDRYPDDPRAMNSFAWFCASRKIGLDKALPIALKMVELTDRHPGYLDTLAELYYARGEYDLAIEAGTEALKKEPGDKYLADQVEKFKRAKAEAGSSSRS
jgi:thioredoxin-related protein/lipopolysaccharide biosynthesis regulator YciM